ncbi:hypothetical protein DITRI_Ditri02bG0071900 [Diplodiscus trichospermus]
MEAFASQDDSISKTNELLKAYGLLQIFKRIFVNLLLSSWDRDTSLAVFQNLSFKKAFEVVEMELSFMYDLLYTKASMVYSRGGLSLRGINLSLACIVLVLFSLDDDKHKYKKADLVITFILLAVAMMLEIYAALVILFSDWAFVWLTLHKRTSVLKSNLKRSKTSLLPQNSETLKCLAIVEKQEKERYVTKEVISNSLKA